MHILRGLDRRHFDVERLSFARGPQTVEQHAQAGHVAGLG
jgi:hypothetical protein